MIALILPSFLVSIATLTHAKTGFSFTPSKTTTRVMLDDDQTSCQTYYGAFMLGGDNYPIIGMGDDLFKGGVGCNQCVQLEYKGNIAYGMLGDSGIPKTNLDIAPILAKQLGFTPNTQGGDHPFHDPSPMEVKATFVSCAGLPGLDLGGKLRYYFGPGSKDTSIELVIHGGAHPITAVTMTLGGKVIQGVREIGKFRFLGGFVLKPNSIVVFTVTFDDGSVRTDTVPLTSIVSGQHGGNFFKSGTVTTDRGPGYNKLNPAVLTWPDFVDGASSTV